MALIPIQSALATAMKALDTLPENGAIVLFSYKRNRKIIIIKRDTKTRDLIEDGYVKQKKRMKNKSNKSIEKELKTVIKREFPRSRKVRLYKFANIIEFHDSYQKI